MIILEYDLYDNIRVCVGNAVLIFNLPATDTTVVPFTQCNFSGENL